MPTQQERTGSRIDDMIASAVDPEVRATLTLLSRIEHSLTENTRATGAIANRLEDHINEFKDHKGRIAENIATMRGAWWAGIALVSVIFTITAGLGGVIIKGYVDANIAQDAAIAQGSSERAQIRDRMTNVEGRANVLEQRMNFYHPNSR